MKFSIKGAEMLRFCQYCQPADTGITGNNFLKTKRYKANDIASGIKQSDLTSKSEQYFSEEQLSPREDVKLSLTAQ